MENLSLKFLECANDASKNQIANPWQEIMSLNRDLYKAGITLDQSALKGAMTKRPTGRFALNSGSAHLYVVVASFEDPHRTFALYWQHLLTDKFSIGSDKGFEDIVCKDASSLEIANGEMPSIEWVLFDPLCPTLKGVFAFLYYLSLQCHTDPYGLYAQTLEISLKNMNAFNYFHFDPKDSLILLLENKKIIWGAYEYFNEQFKD